MASPAPQQIKTEEEESLPMTDDDELQLVSAKGPRKRRVSEGLTRHDLAEAMDRLGATLTSKLDQSFDRFRGEVSRDIAGVRHLAQSANTLAEQAKQTTEHLTQELEQVKRQLRELSVTPPATPRSNRAVVDTEIKKNRLVFTGWAKEHHRTELLAAVGAILQRATAANPQLVHSLEGHSMHAPKVYGKTVLLDMREARAMDVLPLVKPFVMEPIKLKVDRPLSERIRSQVLVSVAKSVDSIHSMHAQGDDFKRAEICWGDGLVWYNAHKLGQYSRPSGAWTWNDDQLAVVFTAEEITKLKLAVAQRG
mmetsp:Transcript_58227/g.107504  ORF Transcript_58227/g.107504 Transcript_58227/m.107504 type:complete len:308 (-) Transcript_58227:575-1498(-)